MASLNVLFMLQNFSRYNNDKSVCACLFAALPKNNAKNHRIIASHHDKLSSFMYAYKEGMISNVGHLFQILRVSEF